MQRRLVNRTLILWEITKDFIYGETLVRIPQEAFIKTVC